MSIGWEFKIAEKTIQISYNGIRVAVRDFLVSVKFSAQFNYNLASNFSMKTETSCAVNYFHRCSSEVHGLTWQWSSITYPSGRLLLQEL